MRRWLLAGEGRGRRHRLVLNSSSASAMTWCMHRREQPTRTGRPPMSCSKLGSSPLGISKRRSSALWATTASTRRDSDSKAGTAVLIHCLGMIRLEPWRVQLLSDKFLYVFKTGPSRARKRAATTGRAACPPLRFAALWARPLAWRARANRVPSRRQHNSPSMPDTRSVHHSPKRPATALHGLATATRLSLGSRIAPLAIMEGTARHGTRQGRLRRPSGISDP